MNDRFYERDDWDIGVENTPTNASSYFEFVRNAPTFADYFGVRKRQSSNTTHTDKKFDYYGQDYWILDGKVFVHGDPVGGAVVSVVSKNAGYFDSRGACVTDENGYYKLTYNDYLSPDNYRLMVEIAGKDEKFNTQVKDYAIPRAASNIFTSDYSKQITADMIPYMKSTLVPYYNYLTYANITSTASPNASYPFSNIYKGNSYGDFGTGSKELIIDLQQLMKINYIKMGYESAVSMNFEIWHSYSIDNEFSLIYDSKTKPADNTLDIMLDNYINTRYLKIKVNGTNNRIDYLMVTHKDENINKSYYLYSDSTQVVNFFNLNTVIADNSMRMKVISTNAYHSIGFKDRAINNMRVNADMYLDNWVSTTRFGLSIRQTLPRLNTSNNFSQTILFGESQFWILNYYTGNQNSHRTGNHNLTYGWNNVEISAYGSGQVYKINGQYYFADSYHRSQSDKGLAGFTMYANSTATELSSKKLTRSEIKDSDFYDYIIPFDKQSDIDTWVQTLNCRAEIVDGAMVITKLINERPLIKIKGLQAMNFIAEYELSYPTSGGDNCGLVYNTADNAFNESGRGFAYIMYVGSGSMGGGWQGNTGDQSTWNSLGSANISNSSWDRVYVSRFDDYHTTTVEDKNSIRLQTEKSTNTKGYFGFSGYLPSKTSFKVKNLKIKILDNPPVPIGAELIKSQDLSKWLRLNESGIKGVFYNDETKVTKVNLVCVGGLEHIYQQFGVLDIGSKYRLRAKITQINSAASGYYRVGAATTVSASGDSGWIVSQQIPVVTSNLPQSEVNVDLEFTATTQSIFFDYNFGYVSDGYAFEIDIKNVSLTKIS